MRALSALIGLGVMLAASQAHAFGEPITDVRILDNSRTLEDTVRSIAGVSIGDAIEATTIDEVRERLNNAGLFSEVNVWWEPRGRGVRLNIAVKDKFPWAPVPTFSTSPGNYAFGVALVHNNLFGQGKQMLLYGRLATIDSGLVVGYRDPSFLGSWLYWEARAMLQRNVIPEYAYAANDYEDYSKHPAYETAFWSYGAEATLGVAWFRRVKTQCSWRIEQYDVDWTKPVDAEGHTYSDPNVATEAQSHAVGMLKPSITFDWRARENSLVIGPALLLGLDYGSRSFGGNIPRDFWKVNVSWEHGIRFYRQHNFIYRFNVHAGENLPIWAENYLGGGSLRGYFTQQFRGDTQVSGKAEYHVPLFSVGPLDLRALGFLDTGLVWYRNLPSRDTTTGAYPMTPNGRIYPQTLEQGLNLKRDFHNSVGGGLRFFLRSIALPLIGVDFGYGLESGDYQWFLMIGA